MKCTRNAVEPYLSPHSETSYYFCFFPIYFSTAARRVRAVSTPMRVGDVHSAKGFPWELLLAGLNSGETASSLRTTWKGMSKTANCCTQTKANMSTRKANRIKSRDDKGPTASLWRPPPLTYTQLELFNRCSRQRNFD